MKNLLAQLSSQELTEWIAIYAMEAEEIERARQKRGH